MGIPAGSFNLRLTIQRKTEVVDPATGYRTDVWADLIGQKVPAKWLPGPGREYLASESVRAEVTGRFLIRYSAAAAAITAADRVIWDGRVMALKAPPLPDETGRLSFTLMVGEVPDGA